MAKIPSDYLQRVYAGWLGKIIGIRHGAPIEGWDYWKIKDVYGEIDNYPVDYRDFAADDDSNGPLFFLRALEYAENPLELQPQHVAQALLNYAPYEHGFFWWGGYGISTEHTAYLNLRSGIPAPRSGSIAQNGAAVAEQIGGQIFIDTWGLVAPGNPELAARLAQSAASVMHGGNGVYGGIFVAVCISLAFTERDIRTVIEKALTYIPQDCEYVRAARAVMRFRDEHPSEDWRACFRYIWENFGYDRYPGVCHIIPNAAVMILSMLYGEGDFVRTINICNMCGWDTDCNVGNVATILGVLTGLRGVDEAKWIRPVHDLLICSGVMGSLNIMDVPYGASYIAKWAYRLAGEAMPQPMAEILSRSIDGCHFEYEYSTHSVRVRGEEPGKSVESYLSNSDEQARTGSRSLKICVPDCRTAQERLVYKRTHYEPRDFYDSRYDPCFSPVLYPGQSVHAAVYLNENSCAAKACLYVRDAHSGEIHYSDPVQCRPGEWLDLDYEIPAMRGALLDEAGVCFRMMEDGDLHCWLDDLYFDGAPDYSVELSGERTEVWTPMHKEISQFTRLKGLMYLEDGCLHLTGADFAEAYTGRHDWCDLTAKFRIAVQQGEQACVNFRVQGAVRSYAAGFDGKGRLSLLKNSTDGYKTLYSVPFEWQTGEEYEITVEAQGNRLSVICGDARIAYVDETEPYCEGAVGISARNGSHMKLSSIEIKGRR